MTRAWVVTTALGMAVSGLMALRFAPPAAAQQAVERLAILGDPVARLDARLDAGDATLLHDASRFGYLESVLKALDITPDSQVLVFSKTSLQQELISPRTPRAIYFNDAVAVAYVQGSGMLEFAGIDPERGPAFYTLTAARATAPRFERHTVECARCHSAVNQFAQGIMVTNSFTTPDGTPVYTGAPTLFVTTDHRTPIKERWGGWYVSGTHGAQPHFGNAVTFDADGLPRIDAPETQNATDLSRWFDTTKYLTPTSDIVALMTLEHQTRAVNLIASASAQARRLRVGSPTPQARARLDSTIEELVTYLVFADEAPLAEPVRGVSSFTRTFAARGPRDPQGRSLRDFDLRTRLFRYPLSYLVYSAGFDGMPEEVRTKVYRRLFEVLSGADTRPTFSRISSADRQAALEILRATKAGLPTTLTEDAR